MGELSEREQRQLEELDRKFQRMLQKDKQFEERKAASGHLWALFDTWMKEPGRSSRTFNRALKEMERLLEQVNKGKIDDLDQRFAQTMERAVATTLPKKRLTYLKLSKALQELVDLNTQWSQTSPRSKAEQDALLHKLRLLLLEIEAGQVDNITERFHQAMQQQQSQREVEGGHHAQEPGDSEHPSRG